MPERRIIMDLLYAMRDLGVADPAADSSGEQTVRAALVQAIDQTTVAPRPLRARRTRPRLLAGATGLVAASAAAVTLLVSAAATPPAAFAVTRHYDGSVSLKISRTTSLADVNRRLAAMGIEEIDTRTVAASDDLSSIPSCSSIPSGWKGEWVQVPTVGNTGASNSGSAVFWSGAPGTWHLVICTADNPGGTQTSPTSYRSPAPTLPAHGRT
jgi:hypothetical protein